MAVYPNVDEDNYSQHKQLLKNYSSDPEYAFLLTALSG